MDITHLPDEFYKISEQLFNRRKFMKGAGMVGLGAAVAPFLATVLTPVSAHAEAEASGEAASETAQAKDTVVQIATAALIAEDLATTFYYHALTGPVIHDPSLAGPGGTANHVNPTDGNMGNVQYIQAALSEEIAHANLLRTLLKIPDAAHDPAQTFYFPAGTFDTLTPFTSLLDALESAFIGAYLNAIQEFSKKAVWVREQQLAHKSHDDTYSPEQLSYLAKVSASIMGIECEHRVLGRVISNSNPANNRNYETTDGITAVYNGANSAVLALTPFLTASTGPAYSLHEALQNQASVSIAVGGTPPAF